MVEDFVLLGVGLAVICLRIWVRVKAIGWRGLMPDDYIMLAVAVGFPHQRTIL